MEVCTKQPIFFSFSLSFISCIASVYYIVLSISCLFFIENMLRLATQLSYPVFLQQCVKSINVFGGECIGVKFSAKEIIFCANRAVVKDTSPQAFITVAAGDVFTKYEIRVGVEEEEEAKSMAMQPPPADANSNEEATGADTADKDAIFMIVDAEALQTLLKGTDDAANVCVTLDVEESGNHGGYDIILTVRRVKNDAEYIHSTRNLKVQRITNWNEAEMGEPYVPVYDAAILINRCQTVKRVVAKFMTMAEAGIITIGDGHKLVVGMKNEFLSSVCTTFLSPTVGDAEFYANIKAGVCHVY